MNKHLDPKSLEPFRVTTGPLPASQKLYSAAPGFPDVMVPYREISVHPSANEAPIRVYDTTGPYTDPAVDIDVHAGLPPIRNQWKNLRAVETYEPRAVKPEDNGNVTGGRAVPAFPHQRKPLRRFGLGEASGQALEKRAETWGLNSDPQKNPVTQLEYARAGIITPEMAYVAHRENACREAMADGAEARRADGE
ncbi:MAG: phosphomethylpyrimidine synthase, partial [Sphingomonadales bacterium]